MAPYPLLYDHGWQIDFPSLSRTVTPRTRALVVVHPNNPTGSYVSSGERAQLNSFCREHGLALIVDEVFLDYPHDGVPRPSFVLNPDVLTFTLSGLSKISGLPQMKLAWVATSGPAPAADCGHGPPGSDCRHLPFDECSHPAGRTVSAGAAENIQPLLLDRLRVNLARARRSTDAAEVNAAFAG